MWHFDFLTYEIFEEHDIDFALLDFTHIIWKSLAFGRNKRQDVILISMAGFSTYFTQHCTSLAMLQIPVLVLRLNVCANVDITCLGLPLRQWLQPNHNDGFVQETLNPSALAMELRFSCFNRSISQTKVLRAILSNPHFLYLVGHNRDMQKLHAPEQIYFFNAEKTQCIDIPHRFFICEGCYFLSVFVSR